MSDNQLAALLENLSRAKAIEAAALLDVKDAEAQEAKAIEKLKKAKRSARYATERCENARLALNLRIEAQTDTDFEPSIDVKLITGPEQDPR